MQWGESVKGLDMIWLTFQTDLSCCGGERAQADVYVGARDGKGALWVLRQAQDRLGKVCGNFVEEPVYSMMLRDYETHQARRAP